MSIAGIFPPICDYKDGHLLVDGCYVNNVPGNEIIEVHCKKACGLPPTINCETTIKSDRRITDFLMQTKFLVKMYIYPLFVVACHFLNSLHKFIFLLFSVI